MAISINVYEYKNISSYMIHIVPSMILSFYIRSEMEEKPQIIYINIFINYTKTYSCIGRVGTHQHQEGREEGKNKEVKR